jgi:hypothetical protein
VKILNFLIVKLLMEHPVLYRKRKRTFREIAYERLFHSFKKKN